MDIVHSGYAYSSFMNCVLLCLHIYWFATMIQMTSANLAKLAKNRGNTFHNTFDFGQ